MKNRSSLLPILCTQVEPAKCAIGPNHVVIALQNKAWFYHYSGELSSPPVEIGSLKYNATIEEIKVTKNCVFFLSEKRVIAQHLKVRSILFVLQNLYSRSSIYQMVSFICLRKQRVRMRRFALMQIKISVSLGHKRVD